MNIKAAIVGGNFGSGTHSVGATILNIDNSTFTASENVNSFIGSYNGAIYGGNLPYSKGARYMDSYYTVLNGVKVNIASSAINSKIYAGGGVYGSSSYTEKSTVNGGVTLQITGSQINDIVFGEIIDNGLARYEINGLVAIVVAAIRLCQQVQVLSMTEPKLYR